MKLKFIIASLLLATGITGMQAQEKKEGNPNPWFIQGQLGMTYSTGSTGIGKLLSPSGQIAFGKYITPVWGARLSLSGWQGKAPGKFSGSDAFYYGALTADGLMNISQLIEEYPERPVDMSAILGIGFNRAYHGASSFMARVGAQMGVRLNDAFDFNVEATLNGVSDRWNGRDDHGIDTYINLGVGVTYKFNSGQKDCVTCISAEPAPFVYTECEMNKCINDARQEVIKNDTVFVEKVIKETSHGRASHVVFELAKTNIQPSQEMNIQAIADYLNEHPEAKVKVNGYADKGTGTEAINIRLAKERAEVVKNCLINKYGIAADRITAESMTDVNDQPFKTNDWNRVVIMIAD